MNGTDYPLIMWVLVVLIYFKIKFTYNSAGQFTRRQIGWTLDKSKAFHVHLPSRINSLGGNLAKEPVPLFTQWTHSWQKQGAVVAW